MNYLAHALLSGNDTMLLTGNMIADFVKGRKPLALLPEGIARGIMLHRFIDAYTDTHPAALRAAVFFRPAYGLYSHAILDVLFDHFLANDPAYFPSVEALAAFSRDVYATLNGQQQFFPERFARMFPYMQQHNWLLAYRQMGNMRKTLNGLRHRATHMPDTEHAFELFAGHYYQLNQAYLELMEGLVKAVKIELTALRP